MKYLLLLLLFLNLNFSFTQSKLEVNKTNTSTIYIDLDLEGDMESIVKRGEGIHFWVKSGGRSIISCDIVPSGDEINIHLYHSVGRWDKYYSGHLASTEEVKNLLRYIRKD